MITLWSALQKCSLSRESLTFGVTFGPSFNFRPCKVKGQLGCWFSPGEDFLREEALAPAPQMNGRGPMGSLSLLTLDLQHEPQWLFRKARHSKGHSSSLWSKAGSLFAGEQATLWLTSWHSGPGTHIKTKRFLLSFCSFIISILPSLRLSVTSNSSPLQSNTLDQIPAL